MSIVSPSAQLQTAHQQQQSSSFVQPSGTAVILPNPDLAFAMDEDDENEQDQPESTELPLDVLINEISPDLMEFFNERQIFLDHLLANEDHARNAAIAAAAAASASAAAAAEKNPVIDDNVANPPSSSHAAPGPNIAIDPAVSCKTSTPKVNGKSSAASAVAAAAAAAIAAAAAGNNSSPTVPAPTAAPIVPPAAPPAVVPALVGPSTPTVNASPAQQDHRQLRIHPQHASPSSNHTFVRPYVQPQVQGHPINRVVAPAQIHPPPPLQNIPLNNVSSYPSQPSPTENLSPSASVSAFNHPNESGTKAKRTRGSSPRQRQPSSPTSNQQSRNPAQGSSSRRPSSPNRVRRARVGEKRSKPGKDSSLAVAAAANRVKKEAVTHPASSQSSLGQISHMNCTPSSSAVNPSENGHSILLPPGVQSNSVGAAAAVAAMAAVHSATGGISELRMDEASEINSEDKTEGQGDSKKMMRAERNRQSAAASRERKKEHIKELERRVALLSEQNAMLQVSQLQQVRDRLAEEAQLLAENDNLRRTVVFKEMEISKLSHKLKSHNIDDEDESSIRRHTWDHSLWNKRGGKK